MATDSAWFAEEWIASWNAHDAERILSHYAETFVFNAEGKVIKVFCHYQ